MSTIQSKVKLVETFDDTPSISLSEGSEDRKSSRVDGKYIIGMIEGQFFKPDGMSRNGRWYPKSLWVKSLARADIKNRLQTSTMFGEIGHSDGPVEDMTLRQGCASHFIDDLWIDEKNRGMGRAYILNTPTGQLLKIYLGAGCKLKVSTRGEGNYKEGETHDGCPVVDDDTYDFQTVDFVLNPGFLETSAILKESYNRLNNQIIDNKKIQETIAHVKKEGEKRMEFNIDAYVADLKEELKSVKAENKTLNEQLQAKNNELLQSKLNGNVEVKKLTEELKPFKALKVSAKSITDSFKKLQSELKTTKAEKVELGKKLKAYEDYCGSVDELKEGIKLSAKSLKMIEEYRKIGTPVQFKEALQKAKDLDSHMVKLNENFNITEKENVTEAVQNQMNETEQTLVKSIDYIKSLKENLAKSRASKRELMESKRELARSRKLINELYVIAKKAEKLSEKYEALRSENIKAKKNLQESKKTLERASVALKDLKECKKLSEALVKKYGKVSVNESLTINKSGKAVKENAIKLSEKFGCSVETAAKLINKNGVEKAESLIESVIKKIGRSPVNFNESEKLIEEVAQLDKVNNVPAEKTAKDFLKDGMIKNYFNQEALGKEVFYKDFSNLDGTKNAGENKAKELLNKYNGKFEVEKAPEGLDKELTPAQAEAEAKKLLK